MDPVLRRRSLRDRLRTDRDNLPPDVRSRNDEAIRGHLARFLEGQRTLLAFYPSKGEPDIIPFLSECLKSGMEVAFPAVHRGIMRFHLSRDSRFIFSGEYRGIPQPSADTPPAGPFDNHTVCLVPGLVFTPAGYRLGYGGGFYDRLLAGFPGRSVGIAYGFQTGHAFPVFDHDVPVDYICNETGIEQTRQRSRP